MLSQGLRGRYVRGAFWSAFSAAISQGFALVAAVVVARILGPAGYGEYGIINRTTAMFGVFAGFGLGTAANRFIAELRVTNPVRAGRVWGLIENTAALTSSLAALLIVAMAPVLSERVLNAPHLARLLWLSAIALVFNTLMGIQNGALAGFEAFRKLTWVGFTRGVAGLPIMIGCAWFWGLPGAVAGLGLVGLASFAVGRSAVRSEADRHGVIIRHRGVWGERSVIWQYSLPAFTSTAILIVGEWISESLLVRQPVVGRVQMGLWFAAAQWTAAIEFVQNTLSGPVISLTSNVYWTGDRRQFRKLVFGNLALVGGGAAAVASAVALAAPWIIRAYGVGFDEAVRVLQLVCAMSAVRAASRATSNVLYATNRVRTEWACSMVRITVQLGVWVLLLDWGAAGLALAMLAAFLVQFLMQGVIVLNSTRGAGPAPLGAH